MGNTPCPGRSDLLFRDDLRGARVLADHVRVGAQEHLYRVAKLLRDLNHRQAACFGPLGLFGGRPSPAPAGNNQELCASQKQRARTWRSLNLVLPG